MPYSLGSPSDSGAKRGKLLSSTEMVSSLWSSGTAVEVHADGPVSIPIASKDEDIYTGPTDMQESVAHPTKFFF